MPDVFISYAEQDRHVAEQIGEIVPGFGYTTWFYDRDYVPGVPHLETTMQQIAACSVVVVLVSHASLESDFVFPELLHAVTYHKHLIPVLIQLRYNELEYEKPQWAKALGFSVAVTWEDGDEALMGLVRGLVALLGERVRPKFDINAKDKEGHTALAIALIACDEHDREDVQKRTEMISLLLQHGADPNIGANDGTTPLMVAKQKKLDKIVEMLRAAGATE